MNVNMKECLVLFWLKEIQMLSSYLLHTKSCIILCTQKPSGGWQDILNEQSLDTHKVKSSSVVLHSNEGKLFWMRAVILLSWYRISFVNAHICAKDTVQAKIIEIHSIPSTCNNIKDPCPHQKLIILTPPQSNPIYNTVQIELYSIKL